jgi:aspartyl-tRNA(Asn)/glutamyl-tRNA(Gln) amidotransferase subunit C
MDANAPPPGPRIDADFVRRVAALARLKVEDDQLDALTTQFARILALVGEVAALKVPHAEGDLLAPLSLADLRPDEPGPTLARREITRNAPAHDGAFLVVPRFHGEEG